MKLLKNQKGIAHHLLLVGVAVLVLGAVGFAGFRVYQDKNIKAKAATVNYSKQLPNGSAGQGAFFAGELHACASPFYGGWLLYTRLVTSVNQTVTGYAAINASNKVTLNRSTPGYSYGNPIMVGNNSSVVFTMRFNGSMMPGNTTKMIQYVQRC